MQETKIVAKLKLKREKSTSDESSSDNQVLVCSSTCIYICTSDTALCTSIYSTNYANNECLLIAKSIILWSIYHMVFLMYLIYIFLFHEHIHVPVALEEKVNVECQATIYMCRTFM